LKVHRESREMVVYELTVAKNGPKLKESAKEVPGAAPSPPPPPRTGPPKMGPDGFPELQAGRPGLVMMNGRARRRAVKESMEEFASTLSSLLGGPVHNSTELSGKYDFDLDWATDDWVEATPPPQLQHGGAIPGESDNGSGPTIFEAVRTQLGLSLERKKGHVEVLVVDRVEKRPTEN
jgi:uncharacterized protein (TIGR03435 family)